MKVPYPGCESSSTHSQMFTRPENKKYVPILKYDYFNSYKCNSGQLLFLCSQQGQFILQKISFCEIRFSLTKLLLY